MNFDLKRLKNTLETISSIDFALIFGSSKAGEVKTNSDVDIGIYFNSPAVLYFDEMSRILTVLEEKFPGITFDIIRLNTAGIIVQMEALKGNAVFVRDIDKYAEFYSITSREYEDHIYWIKKQLLYRGYINEVQWNN